MDSLDVRTVSVLALLCIIFSIKKATYIIRAHAGACIPHANQHVALVNDMSQITWLLR